MSYPLTQSIASVLRKVRWVKCLVHHIEKFFGLIILDLCINVHSCFAIFMSGKILNRLGINACIEQIRDVGVPLRYNKDKRKNPVFSRVSAFVVAYSIPFPTLIASEKSVE